MPKKIKDYENFDLINAHTTNYMEHISAIPLEERLAYEERIEKEPIRYENCLSLMEIGRKLNDLYVAFMKDYNALPEKLDLGEELDIQRYSERNYEDGFGRTAEIFVYLNNQIEGNNCSADFMIMEHNGEIRNAFTNKFLQCSRNREQFYKRLDIDNSILKSYLDLFQKHQEFIKVFANTEHVGLSDQTWVLMELFKDRDLDITNGLKTLEIHGYLTDEYDFIFDIFFNLGEDFGIDFKKTEFMVHDSKVKFTKEDITNFANSIYVNKYYVLVGINKGPLYHMYDIHDPKVQYKYCEFSEKLKENYGKDFTMCEIIAILNKMIKVYSKPIKLYLEHIECKKVKLQENIRALFAIESYENIINSYEQLIKKESTSRKRKKDNQ